MCPPPFKPYAGSSMFADMREPSVSSTPHKKPFSASVNAPFKVPRRMVPREDSLFDPPKTTQASIKDDAQRAPRCTEEVINRVHFLDNGANPVITLGFICDTKEDAAIRLDTFYEHRFPYFLTNWKVLAGCGYYCVDKSHQVKCVGCGHSNPGLWFWRFTDLTNHHGEGCPFGSAERKT